MTNTGSDFVTLGADVGGKDAFQATNQHVLALRNLLRQEVAHDSASGLNEIALVLRIDGSVQAWGRCDVDNISFQKKKSYVTGDIFIPVDAWSSGDALSFRRFLIGRVMRTMQLVAEEVNRQGCAVDWNALEVSLETVERRYLG